MEPNPPIRRKGRETVLTLSLVGILGGAFLFFLNLVTLGVFFYVAATVIGIAAVGFLHYSLWGYALSQQVVGEREEQRIQDMLEADARREEGHLQDRYPDDRAV